MYEIVVISGKGGTGKTSLTAAFAALEGPDTVLADCDVDAPNLHLLMQPDLKMSHDFYSGVIACIDPRLCNDCGVCKSRCRFDAILITEGHYSINARYCEGCGYCANVCPEKAVKMLVRKVGTWSVATTRLGSWMVHAHLGAGGENTGKLVAKVKNEARQVAHNYGKKTILVDGTPGIGCPVISSLSGAGFVLLVAEPSASGWHDLTRISELIQKFKLRAGCIINKTDLNPEISSKIKTQLQKEKITYLGELPYDEAFTAAMTKGRTIIEYNSSSLKNTLSYTWKKIKQITKLERY